MFSLFFTAQPKIEEASGPARGHNSIKRVHKGKVMFTITTTTEKSQEKEATVANK